MSGQKGLHPRGGKAVAVLAELIALSLPRIAYADAPDVPRVLDLITQTADKICNVVSTTGEANSSEVKGQVKAQLSGLAAKLAEVGVAASGSINNENYQNVLRQDLATTLQSNAACKLKVFETLQGRLLGSADPSTPSRQATCSVSGLVFDQNSDKPLSSVLIDVYRYAQRKSDSQVLRPNVATTGPDGRFSFNCSGIKETEYPFTFGVHHKDWADYFVTGGKIVRSGEWSGINIPIAGVRAACSISGAVFVQGTNKPISAAWIDVYTEHPGTGERPSRLKNHVATTEPDGKFSFNCRGIKETEYPLLLAVSHPDWGFSAPPGNRIPHSGAYSGVNIPLMFDPFVHK